MTAIWRGQTRPASWIVPTTQSGDRESGDRVRRDVHHARGRHPHRISRTRHRPRADSQLAAYAGRERFDVLNPLIGIHSLRERCVSPPSTPTAASRTSTSTAAADMTRTRASGRAATQRQPGTGRTAEATPSTAGTGTPTTTASSASKPIERPRSLGGGAGWTAEADRADAIRQAAERVEHPHG